MELISANASTNGLRKKSVKKKEKVIPEDFDGEGDSDQEIVLDEASNNPRGKRRHESNEAEEQEMALAQSLFPSLYNPIKFGKHDAESGDESDNECALFFTDNSANSMLSAHTGELDNREETITELEKNQGKPVWVDEEEEKLSVNIVEVNRLRKLRKVEGETVISGSAYVSRLRAQHAKMNPKTNWSQPAARRKYNDDSDEEDESLFHNEHEDHVDGDEILKTNEDLVSKRGVKLLPRILEFSRLVDANANYPSDAPINSVQFHKNAELLLVGGLDRSLKFFQIDGKKNELVQSIFLEDCPIRKAAFLPDGSQVIVSGRRKFAYAFDLVEAKVNKFGPFIGRDEKSLESFEISPDSKTIAFLGDEGHILLASSKTKEMIGTLKMNAAVRSLAFTNDGKQLLSGGDDGRIYVWDMQTMSCMHVGIDEGCLKGTSLCISPDRRLFAAGSSSGIVNLYNREEFLNGVKKPLKSFKNLTENVDYMKFNVDGQILAMGCRRMRNSMRLVHVPSMSVYENWPRFNQPLQYPCCMDFSPRGGFLTVGNAAGKVLLYKLHHYTQA